MTHGILRTRAAPHAPAKMQVALYRTDPDVATQFPVPPGTAGRNGPYSIGPRSARLYETPSVPRRPPSGRRGAFPSLVLGMCQAVAVLLADFPPDLHDCMRPRVHERDGQREVRFSLNHGPRVLPMVHEGKVQLVRWGSEREDPTELPCTRWTWLASVEEGKWAGWRPEEVTVPAASGIKSRDCERRWSGTSGPSPWPTCWCSRPTRTSGA
jgi:hypothetical protein